MPGSWENFFIAGAGAAAALAGLVIVAVSVNISRIIAFRHLPARAGATIGTLILILAVSMAALIPQTLHALGVAALVLSLICWLLHVWAGRQMLVHRRERTRPWYEPLRGILFGQAQTIPFIVGASLLCGAHPGGFYWIAGATIGAFVLATVNAWILLVEILR